MSTLIIVIHIFASIFLICFVLIQAGKGSDLGSALGGGGSSQSVFGTRRGNILTKTTAILATIFMATSLTITVLRSHPTSIIKESGGEGIAGQTDTQAEVAKEKGERPPLGVLPAGVEPAVPEAAKREEPIKEEQKHQGQVKPVPAQVELQPAKKKAPKEKIPPVKKEEAKEAQTNRQVAPQGEKAQPKEEVGVKKEETKEPPSSEQELPSPTEKLQPTTPEEEVSNY